MARVHHYAITVKWTGNTGTGTTNYRSYGRQHEISSKGSKPVIPGSSERIFRGDPSRWNPEELLVASLSACHKLWYLHLCAVSGVNVVAYVDHAEGFLEESDDGSGRFQKVILRPQVTLAAGADVSKARELHRAAHEKCYIANSVNFQVEHDPTIVISPDSASLKAHPS